ncbi:DUF4376 domain-containing protein [Campylobacter sp. 19-13652]|uniref:DUF4376 domain-containing protein n=1 Tax=Campylobacter sp. 19-13652 TaxID=2840180 RepID=UPI001C7863E0|nr:DUF4376 domain-containing protein [Campylobacter sp. 19-13652]BCX79290.1 hypothetical protein LBC_07520 [Campylobacter sp. 19-13652]
MFYNTHTDTIVYDELIQTQDGLKYVKFLSHDELLRLGFKKVIKEKRPENIGKYEQIKEIRTQTDEYYNISYRVIPIDIKEAKKLKREELKLERDAAISEPLNNVQVASGDDLRNIEGAILAFNRLASEGKLAWIMADNSVSKLNKEELEAIRDGYIDRKQKMFNAFALACAKLEMASLPSEISEIKLDKGELDV